MKTISFAVPCFNSADYMDACIRSLLACGKDIEIIIVNDGSTDATQEKAEEWQSKHPDIIQVINQENGGHGAAVNAGLAAASGLYFKVVDSDDWLDPASMSNVMDYLRRQIERKEPTDLVIANYVYDKVHEGTHTTIRYLNALPHNKEFTWDDVRPFAPGQYLLMHSVIYLTSLLKDIHLELPRHCFYVDNIFVYVPLPYVKTLYYLDVDMYHYFIGREDQSVNEKIMLGRIDQQLRITQIMIDEVDIENDVEQRKLARYMYNYLSMMMCICSIFLRMEFTPENEAKRSNIWQYLKDRSDTMYRRVRHSSVCFMTMLPGKLGRAIALGGYRAARKIFKFN